MYYKKIKKELHNSSDLKVKVIHGIEIIYLESLCSSNRINDYIVQNLTIGKDYLFLKDKISGPSVVYITNYQLVFEYLFNGYAFISDGKDMLVCEVKGDLIRPVAEPKTETSINGPKDGFNESIITNLGLIKRRIHSKSFVTKDYLIGDKTKTKVSLLYIDDLVKNDYVTKLDSILSSMDLNDLIDIEILEKKLSNPSFMPTIIKTERPDRCVNSLLHGKVVILADNSCYALILPGIFLDFLHPEGDNYVRGIHVNFLKGIRILCLFLTILLPGLYISLINYNQESIPIHLLLSFQSGRSGVPFPSSFEVIFMILLCAILRESDIRFPSNYGSSISILGALLLGDAAVAANVASPIMIIIVGLTFISGLIFTNGEMISGLRYYRFFVLFLSIFLGLYGLTLGIILVVLHLCSTTSLDEPYLLGIVSTFKKNIKPSIWKGMDESK